MANVLRGMFIIYVMVKIFPLQLEKNVFQGLWYFYNISFLLQVGHGLLQFTNIVPL